MIKVLIIDFLKRRKKTLNFDICLAQAAYPLEVSGMVKAIPLFLLPLGINVNKLFLKNNIF